MDKLSRRFFLSLLLVFLLLLAMLQTPWAKQRIREGMVAWAAKRGVELSIESIEGRLPLEWRLNEVRLVKKGTPPLTCHKLKARLKFLPLLIGRIDCPHLSVQGAQFQGISFDALAAIKGDQLTHLTIEGEGFAISGSGSLESGLLNLSCTNLSTLSHLFPFAIGGSCTGSVYFDPAGLSAKLEAERLQIAHYSLAPTQLNFTVESCPDGWQGAIDLQSGHAQIPLELHLVFSAPQHFPLITVEEASLIGPDTSIRGKFSCTPHLKNFEGNLSAICSDLKSWRFLYPSSQLAGSLELNASLSAGIFKSSLTAQHFNCFKLLWEKLELESEFEGERGHIDLAALKGAYDEIAFDRLKVTSHFNKNEGEYALETSGKWKESLELISSGHFSLGETNYNLQVESFYGFALKKAFNLKDPLNIEWSPSHFKLYPLNFEIGQGEITGRVDLSKEATIIKAEASECPLDFLSLGLPNLTLKGMGSASIDLIGWQENLQGTSHFVIDWAEILPEGRPSALRTKGNIQLHFDQKRTQLHALLRAERDQMVDLTGSFPIEYRAFPLQIALEKTRALSSELTAEIDLEEVLQFINIGPQRIEGRLSTRLFYNGLGLSGQLEIQNGLYENYVTGAVLKEVSAKGIAHEKVIAIQSLTAVDETLKGTLKGTGQIQLTPAFSYLLDSDVENFQAINDQTLVGSFSGHVKISGDPTGAIAKGTLELVEAHMRIPDRLPSELPDLNVTFVNPPDTILEREKPKKRPPFLLDLDLHAPKQIFVEGRGLNCELQGNLHLTGAYPSMAARGTLSLLKGEYLFCGKVFNLNQAELTFKDKPTPSASITLSGSCDLPDVTATVSVRGPLSAPTLTLQSIPQLSNNALLARLLFNKDISEISPLQALQLAQTLLSLSGTSQSTDIFEKVRKTLHIDRLTLLTSENDPGKISLQIGKYLMRGVLLTLVQGASSRNVAVEVELLRGFTLQAEMNEKQQGKFSLKWHHHY